MPGNFPPEQNILHLRPITNIVHNHPPPICSATINHNADVRHIPAKIPGDQIARRVIIRTGTNRQRLSLAAEKRHQVWNSPVIDIRIGARKAPQTPARIGLKIPEHVLMHLFLKVDSHDAIRTNDFIGADTGIGGHIPTGIRNAHVRSVVANCMVGSLDSGSDESAKKVLLSDRDGSPCLRGCEKERACENNRQQHCTSAASMRPAQIGVGSLLVPASRHFTCLRLVLSARVRLRSVQPYFWTLLSSACNIPLFRGAQHEQ